MGYMNRREFLQGLGGATAGGIAVGTASGSATGGDLIVWTDRDVSDVSTTSANVGAGSFVWGADDTRVETSIRYRTQGASEWNETAPVTGDGGTIRETLTGLDPGTTYEYRGYGTVPETGDVDTGAVRTFSTKSGADSDVSIEGVEDVDWPVGITATRERGRIFVEGSIAAPQPCFEAVVRDHSVEDGVLTVDIDIEPTGETACPDVESTIEYLLVYDGPAVADIDLVTVTDVPTETASDGAYQRTTHADDVAADTSDVTVETVEQACASGDEFGISVETTDGSLVVSGTTQSPTYASYATLTDYSVDGGTLTLDVGYDTFTAQTPGCAETSLSYEMVVDGLAAGDIETVTLNNPETGDRYTQSVPRQPLTSSVQTTGQGCLGQDTTFGVDAHLGSDAVTLTGTTSAPVPCSAATVDSLRQRENVLYVTVGTELEQSGTQCRSCEGAIDYSVTVRGGDISAFEYVVVTHADSGQTYVEP